ncbi:hypothetical protein [Ancylomarina longa]|uniref:Uncharacterized protein n=1 Tax=Ancylomarina longa TaxID=2487017 RepID=A0A434AXY6_9BACT|nr:hypothetical protein [Ancylomarina longa]RUT79417.1 hypothetical protein DLK05_04140 [Ancylomarina longa]
MILDKKHKILAWFLSLAFILPILIKSQHMMFPNHEHHSIFDHSDSFTEVCQIQIFDYFFFTTAEIISVPPVAEFEYHIYRTKSPLNSCYERAYGYSLRAPPIHFFNKVV